MNIFKILKNNSLCSTVLYISRIVYSNPYYVPDMYYLCPDPHLFRIGVKMINMCGKAKKSQSPWSRVRCIFFMDRNRSKNDTALTLKNRS
jgi:hypothetical protein